MRYLGNLVLKALNESNVSRYWRIWLFNPDFQCKVEILLRSLEEKHEITEILLTLQEISLVLFSLR